MPNEKVKCPICGGLYRMITWKHIKMHGLTVPEFEELYPDFSRVSESLREEARLRTIKQFSTQETRDAARLRTLDQFSTQEARDRHSKIGRKYWSIQTNRDAQSKLRLKSDAVKKVMERQRGGLDLCWHHIAYDFSRPEALRVRITRKFHSLIHHPKGIQFHQRGYSLID